jgi:serine/threonine-protein kinase
VPESPAPKFELIGTTVGNYTITRKLSRGGMGTVYGAQHALLGNAAAVKVLRPEFSNNKDIVNRFFKEAKATTSIKHPGIVEVWDYGYLASGDAYIVMEFLEGQTLARRIKRGGRFQEGAAAMLVRGVCSGLAAAHDKGIVHRDLKPDNLFLVPDAEAPLGERVKILDFGIAKLTDVGLADTATKTGAVMGTPTYMSPEQCKGTGDIDLRADLYSLGCILYELLCGRPPFTKLGSGELIGAHLHVTPELPSKHEPGISAPMEKLIMSLLAKDPAERPSSAPALSRELAAIARDHGFATTSPSLATLAQPLPPVADDHPALESKFAVDVEVSGTATIQDPTTLSGAANSKPIAHAPKRRGLRVSIAIAAAGLAGGLVLARMTASSEAPAVTATPPAVIMPARATAPSLPPPAPPPAPPIVTAPAPAPAPAPTIAAAPVKPAAIAPKKKHKKPVAATLAGSNAAPANPDLHGPVVDDL